ncbi:MAG TPA: acetyl-CoA carboxylase biotin carboxyl carrier protein subunit [Prolixibacteraceae bacterium]|jgi:biotin carboxyl carrier protein|nr:acetyl-CoA carboxylase biotin carboxyl carrier protein subunit [Prolixibacteraceae bacterium]
MKKYSFTINGNLYDVAVKNVDDNVAEVEVNGFNYSVEFDRSLETTKTPKLVRSQVVPSTDITPSEQKTSSPAGPKGAGFVRSPLPGTILDVHVTVGDTVRSGDKLITLEAMKMENIINSDKGGKVTSIKFKKGDPVMEGDILIEIG